MFRQIQSIEQFTGLFLMSTVPAYAADTLLSCFFKRCEEHLTFLETRHGYAPVIGLTRFSRGRQIIYPYRPGNTALPFRACARFENGALTLEFSYGEDDLRLDVFLYYRNIYRLSLPEILEAAQKQDSSCESKTHLATPACVAEAIENLAFSIRAHKRYFLKENERLIEKALTMRAIRLEHKIREQLRSDLSLVSVRAAEAYAHKDYKKVIALLTPYKNYLSPADIKKLEKARANLLRVP
ncbi:MAG: hypothetical protein K9G62_06060 [Alphaproteobacteria bacterium]|nr:hypothetical protein [Alphaproteobacteria bacterium]